MVNLSQLGLSMTDYLSTNFSKVSRYLNASLASPLNAIILTTCLGTLGGLVVYHQWNKDEKGQQGITSRPTDQIKAKVAKAYAYVFAGFTITAISGIATHVSGVSLKILLNWTYAIPVSLTSLGALIATLMISKEDTKIKHIAWAIFNISLGVALAPLGLLDPAIIAQAAFISLGVGAILSLTAYLLPDRSALKWEVPFLAALSTISIASAVAIFFPQTAFAYGIGRVSLYGGLVAFSGLFIASTQRLLDEAQKLNKKFDVINSSLSIYIDFLNLLMYIIQICDERAKKQES